GRPHLARGGAVSTRTRGGETTYMRYGVSGLGWSTRPSHTYDHRLDSAPRARAHAGGVGWSGRRAGPAPSSANSSCRAAPPRRPSSSRPVDAVLDASGTTL